MKNSKKYICLILAAVMMMLSSACSLAVEDAGEEVQENADRLIGVFITNEHLDLFDVDAYLEDHIDEVVDGEELTVDDASQYNGRIYATVDKHDSTDPSDWDISFEGVEGICFVEATWEYENGEPFTMNMGGEEICDVEIYHNVTDEGEATTLKGSIYALVEEESEEKIYFMNPVYQTDAGEIYVTAGTGGAVSGEYSASMTIELKEECMVEKDDQKMTYSGAVKVTVEVLKSAPAKVRIHHLDSDLAILHTEEYLAGEVPVSLETVEGTACVVVETEWEDGEVTRALYEQGESESTFIETFCKVNDLALGRQSTEVLWK